MIKRVILGLGSNLDSEHGDRIHNIESAISKIEFALHLKNIRRSEFYANKALLAKNSPKEWDLEFINLVLSGEIDFLEFGPKKILYITKQIEKEIGRIKSAESGNNLKGWGKPRQIDIDILAIEDVVVSESDLIIPHYDLANREFFLKLIDQTDPTWKYPAFGKSYMRTAKQMLDQL